MSLASLLSTELSESQFNEISNLVKSLCGINLHDGKKELVKARLTKRLRQLQMRSFDEYIETIRNDSQGMELTAMLDALSTNLTSFFRESDHFEYLAKRTIPQVAANAGKDQRQIRIWSAGCSSGEEPYSMAITLCEHCPDLHSWDVRILATDLSTAVLAKARAGLYRSERLEPVGPQVRARHFRSAQTHGIYGVRQHLRDMVHFARLNLMDAWPMRGPFDAIFCRNVMIYFDKPTQAKLVHRFWDILSPGGTLSIGHSESLTGIRHDFRYVQPTIYTKP